MHAKVTAPVPCLAIHVNINVISTEKGWSVHIIVEHCVLCPIFVEETIGISDPEIFKMEKRMREMFTDELYEPKLMSTFINQRVSPAEEDQLVDKIVIFLSSYASIWPALRRVTKM